MVGGVSRAVAGSPKRGGRVGPPGGIIRLAREDNVQRLVVPLAVVVVFGLWGIRPATGSAGTTPKAQVVCDVQDANGNRIQLTIHDGPCPSPDARLCDVLDARGNLTQVLVTDGGPCPPSDLRLPPGTVAEPLPPCPTPPETLPDCRDVTTTTSSIVSGPPVVPPGTPPGTVYHDRRELPRRRLRSRTPVQRRPTRRRPRPRPSASSRRPGDARTTSQRTASCTGTLVPNEVPPDA